MKIPYKRMLVTAIVIALATYLAGQAVPQLGESTAFAAIYNPPSNQTAPHVGEKTSANMSSSASVASANKTFYLFTTETGGVNETKLGISGDVYSLQTMVVNKGDEVTVHFYNLETNPSERHTFTIGAPYNINKDLAGGENATITFRADHEGIFQYHCLHHPPQMIGQLVVLPHPTMMK